MTYKPLIQPYHPYNTLDQGAVDLAAALLEQAGYNLDNQHSTMTPYRLVHYLNYWKRKDKDIHITSFSNTDPKIDNMIVISPVTFWSCCSHHLLPFWGKAYFGYVPKDRLVGLSKVPQLIRDVCARPWLQETMTAHLADLFTNELDPVGLGVVTVAMHTCQMLDLEGADAPMMRFSEMRGAFRDNDAARQEFMTLCGLTGVV